MSTGEKIFYSFIIGWIWGTILVAFLILLSGNTYKDGQIDVLTGKVKYELITKPDSTRVWELK